MELTNEMVGKTKLRNLQSGHIHLSVVTFISVDDALPKLGEQVDIYVKYKDGWDRVCDVVYIGEVYDTREKGNIINVFEFHEICEVSGEDISERYSVQHDGVSYWTKIMYLESDL